MLVSQSSHANVTELVVYSYPFLILFFFFKQTNIAKSPYVDAVTVGLIFCLEDYFCNVVCGVNLQCFKFRLRGELLYKDLYLHV